MMISDVSAGYPQTMNQIDNSRKEGAAEGAKEPLDRGVRGSVNADVIEQLSPGKQLSGTVLEVKDGMVTLKLDSGDILRARSELSSANLGDTLNFEVSRKDQGQISLSLLQTNVAQGSSILKALEMAGIPANESSIGMTDEMMKQGMNIAPKNLQEMFRQVMSLPEANSSEVVLMKQLNLPITEDMHASFVGLKNQTMQILGSIDDISEALTDTMKAMAGDGDTEALGALFRSIWTQASEEGISNPALSGEASMTNQGGEALINASEQLPGQEGKLPPNISNASDGSSDGLNGVDKTSYDGANGVNQPSANETNGISPSLPEDAKIIMQASADGAKVIIRDSLDETKVGAQSQQELSKPVNRDAQIADTSMAQNTDTKNTLLENFFKLARGIGNSDSQAEPYKETDLDNAVKNAVKDGAETLNSQTDNSVPVRESINQLLQQASDNRSLGEGLSKLLNHPDFSRELSKVLSEKVLLTPEEIGNENAVHKLYERVLEEANQIAHALENANKGDDKSAKMVKELQRNVDFLNELNQNFAYVQLPLKMSNQNAQGDLYVYTNKKNLAREDGSVTAMLHLGMDHLGNMDIYVAMRNQSVSTKFYLEDESVIDFLEGHMDELDRQLGDKGYRLNGQVYAMNHEDAGSPFDEMLKDAVSVPGISTHMTKLLQQSFEALA